MLFMSQEFGFRSNVGGPSDLSLGVYTGYQAKRSTEGQLKMTHIQFAILNSNVTVIYLRSIKNTYFYPVKQENWK